MPVPRARPGVTKISAGLWNQTADTIDNLVATQSSGGLRLVGVEIIDDFEVVDSAGDPVEGLDGADFTETAFLMSAPGTTAAVTITEEGGGAYLAAFTPTVAGRWKIEIGYDSGTFTREFTGRYLVSEP